jgi:isoquinoline 1-oxidoreductase beta subunit
MSVFNRITQTEEPTQPSIANVSRRGFLQGIGGLTLGLQLLPELSANAAAGTTTFKPNAFVRIGSDNTVTVIAKHLEMGQGSYTGMATLVAEELDADWKNVVVEGAPADLKLYANALMGVQGTGGSTGMASSFQPMRQAGAAARAMLVSAAASRWNVSPDTLIVKLSVVTHTASGRSAKFGELAEDAATQPIPKNVKLKDAKDFVLIGNPRLARKDSAAKTDGSAIFTQDFKLPGMLIAVVAHPPRFGATVKSFDSAKVKAVPGVVDVIKFDAADSHGFCGVAVLAKNTWAARQGRDALVVQWDESQAFKLGTAEVLAHYKATAKTQGLIAGKKGDIAAALANPAAKLIEAEYEFPYLAHASMEPLNCVVKLSPDRCEIWNGEQWQTGDQGLIAKFLGLHPAQVFLTQLYAGGSFGRRANPFSDYVLEAVAITKAAREKGLDVPVKMVWTREDDMRGGYYRPMNVHWARVALDENGQLLAWHERIVGQSIMKGTSFESFMVKNGVDPTSVEGAADLPYDCANLQVELHTPQSAGIPIQWWRSVGHSLTGFSTEGLIDEAAIAAGKDPLAYRLQLLSKYPRHQAVLQLAAEKAGWNTPIQQGKAGEKRGRGIAVHESFNTFVAHVAEVTVKTDGSLKVDRIVCAVDCGLAVNPDIVKSQMEGGIGFGLAAALHGEISLKEGAVEQSNFDGYQVLRINEMAIVEVHIVPSTDKPTGVGEPGVPPVAPAVANAIYAATDKRIRKLPIANQLKKA